MGRLYDLLLHKKSKNLSNHSAVAQIRMLVLSLPWLFRLYLSGHKLAFLFSTCIVTVAFNSGRDIFIVVSCEFLADLTKKMRIKVKATKKNLILLIIIVIMTKIFNSRRKLNVHTACHYIENDDDLPLIENHRNKSARSVRHIYFHQPSCQPDLDAQQVCVVESAARTHLDRQINVIFSGSVNNIKRWKKHFQQFRNVKFWRMHIDKYLHNTPLQYLVKKGILQTSKYSFTQTRAVLRYATLYKVSSIVNFSTVSQTFCKLFFYVCT